VRDLFLMVIISLSWRGPRHRVMRWRNGHWRRAVRYVLLHHRRTGVETPGNEPTTTRFQNQRRLRPEAEHSSVASIGIAILLRCRAAVPPRRFQTGLTRRSHTFPWLRPVTLRFSGASSLLPW
jgi:hypothetical protein